MEHIKLSDATAGATLSVRIADAIRGQITTGSLPPGQKLPLDQLRTMFGVSLSPVREALSWLAAQGFVVMESHSGYRVAPISATNLAEVTKLRLTLEPQALRESIRRADVQWESEVVATLYRLEKLEKGDFKDNRLEDWEVCHRQLHQQLLAACGMPLLLHFLNILHDLNDRYRRLFLELNPIDRKISDEHTKICAAALERDADQACALLTMHIERTGENLLAFLPAEKV